MQYLLLIYESERDWVNLSEAQQGQVLADYGAFTKSIKDSGNYRAGEALEPTTTATTVRVRDGKTLTTDAPFAETREQLGGFYLIEARDLDEATAIAGRIPTAKHGSVEVRPIMTFG